MARELKEVSTMDDKKSGGHAINKLRRCGKLGCLTHWVMCKPWMCPDYERRKS